MNTSARFALATGVSVRTLPGGPNPIELVSRLPTGGVLLSGRWAGGGAVVAIDPIEVVADADDPFAVLSVCADLRNGSGADGPAVSVGAAGAAGAGAAGSRGAAGPIVAVGSRGSANPANTVGGGWFGWFAFDTGRQSERHAGRESSHLSYFPNVLRYDATSRTWYDEALVGVMDDDELEQRRRVLIDLLATPVSAPSTLESSFVGGLQSMTSRADYESAVAVCIEHIGAGDIYQANICLALEAAVLGDPSALAERLLARLEPPFGAYLPSENGTVVSASPELFLRRAGRRVLSSPIKGTRPRPADSAGAAVEWARLRASAKDRAENVMIVDMVRNDLARVAETGSVRVPDLLRIEPHPGVWHLVSDVTATLRAGASDSDMLRACFPPGSVTGTPKVRALQIIDELEPVPRGVYTGAIGYQSPVAGLELSVAIRTLEIRAGKLRLGVGAGITAGSVPTEEWWECFDKARPIAAALGSRVDTADSERPGID